VSTPHLQALPGKAGSVEVHQNITQRLHVIPPRLLNAQMCVDTGISGSAGEVLVFSVGDVLFGSCISILLGQAKVNDK